MMVMINFQYEYKLRECCFGDQVQCTFYIKEIPIGLFTIDSIFSILRPNHVLCLVSEY